MFCGAPDHIERGMIEIAAVGAVTMLVRVNVASDLDAAQTEIANTAFEFGRREIGILQWNCPEPRKARRLPAHDFSDVIVQEPGKVEGVGRPGPITEHDRHGRKHLHRNPVPIHFLDAMAGVPGVGLYFAEEVIALHHPRAAGVAVFEADETGIAVFRVKIGPVPREDVGVEIDLQGK